jgi:hypothetical protein
MNSSTKTNINKMLYSEDIKKYLKNTINDISGIIYDEMYLYVWFICLYHVILIFLVLANSFVLLKILLEKYYQ